MQCSFLKYYCIYVDCWHAAVNDSFVTLCLNAFVLKMDDEILSDLLVFATLQGRFGHLLSYSHDASSCLDFYVLDTRTMSPFDECYVYSFRGLELTQITLIMFLCRKDEQHDNTIMLRIQNVKKSKALENCSIQC